MVGAPGGSSEGDRRSWYLWAAWLAGLSCSLPRFGPLLTPWVLRELPFLVPLLQAPCGPWQCVCVAPSFLSCGSGYLRCVHTSTHDVQGLPFSASLSCLCPWHPHIGVPSPEALQLLPTLTAASVRSPMCWAAGCT